jgi:hypothetical protein
LEIYDFAAPIHWLQFSAAEFPFTLKKFDAGARGRNKLMLSFNLD